ncbi:MAG: hydrogenase maturation nickel metallochaperone HypA [Gammaproteobacteria bacterium]|nr:hydrogenase maturation nickel metallochaperone HypA [Gammaproteobacteria bacterium]
MHELSIARSLIELACEHAEQQGASRVRRIKVRLGVLSGLLRPLYFCFAASCKGTRCEEAVLEIEEVPLTVMCPRCDEVKTPGSRYSFCCPTCGTSTPNVITGREMQLVALEIENNGARSSPSAPLGDREKEQAYG